MAKPRRPKFRINDRVTLAEHTPLIPAYSGKPFVGRDTVLRVSSIVGRGTLGDPWNVRITDDAGHFWQLSPGDLVLVGDVSHATRRHGTRKSPAQLEREIAAVLWKPSHATKRSSGRTSGEWSDLAPTGIRIETYSGDMPLEEAMPAEIRRDMNRRLAGFRALLHMPARRKKWALAVYELAQAKPWLMDQVPNDVWGIVLTDVGRGGAFHATRKKTSRAESQEMKDLREEKARLLRALDYAGNTRDQVREYHRRLDEIGTLMRALPR